MSNPASLSDLDPEELMFLPGASGNIDVWQPLAKRLSHAGKRTHIGWPGFGPVPRDPDITSISHLVQLVETRLQTPANLFAQSMGGVIALTVTLARPRLVRRLILSVTSGGLDLTLLGASDWRSEFRKSHPEYPTWFEDDRTDLTHRLGEVRCPVLLLWGNADPISPPTVGQRLKQLLPNAELVIVNGGDHDLVATHVAEILPHVDRHLSKPVDGPT